MTRRWPVMRIPFSLQSRSSLLSLEATLTMIRMRAGSG
jgi:hypothetical protein